MEGTRGRSLLFASCAVLVAALSACNKEQQGGTLLDPNPGAYKGGQVVDLSPETLAALAKRAKHQEFYDVGGPK